MFELNPPNVLTLIRVALIPVLVAVLLSTLPERFENAPPLLSERDVTRYLEEDDGDRDDAWRIVYGFELGPVIEVFGGHLECLRLLEERGRCTAELGFRRVGA